MTFDHEAHAAEVKAATKRRQDIAESVERLMQHAKRQGWGEVEGLPTFQGDTMVYHFSCGRRGFVRLPLGTEFE